MLILDKTTTSLEVLLGGAATTTELPINVSYVETDANSITPFATDTITTGGTAVTALAAPANDQVQRQVKFMSVYNADTVAATVTVRVNNGTTTRICIKIALAVASTLFYEDGAGWLVVDTNGNIQNNTTNALLDGTIHNDTLAGAVARGSVIVGNSTPKWARVTVGAAHTVVQTVDGTDTTFSNIFIPQLVRLSSQFDAAATTTLANVTGFVQAIAANEIWTVTWDLFISSGAGGNKFAVTVPSGATLAFGGVSGGSTGFTTTSGTAILSLGAGVSYVKITCTVVNGATPGNIQLQYAQNSASGTSSILVNSIQEAKRLS